MRSILSIVVPAILWTSPVVAQQLSPAELTDSVAVVLGSSISLTPSSLAVVDSAGHLIVDLSKDSALTALSFTKVHEAAELAAERLWAAFGKAQHLRSIRLRYVSIDASSGEYEGRLFVELRMPGRHERILNYNKSGT